MHRFIVKNISISTIQLSQTVLIQTIQFSVSTVSRLKQFYFKQFSFAEVRSSNIKTVLFQVIQLSISTLFSSIWPIERTLSGATTPGQSWPGSDGKEGVLHFPQSSSITGTSPSDYLAWYPGHSLKGEYYPSAVGVFYSPSRLGIVEDRVTCNDSFISTNSV